MGSTGASCFTPHQLIWMKVFSQFATKKSLLVGLLLLPVVCLLGLWQSLPALVPLHFSRSGPDRYGDKHMLLVYVLMPGLLYLVLPFLYPSKTAGGGRLRLGVGAVAFLSLAICSWLLFGMTS